jgi:thiol-disulfide isomerase/thioredoxin/succinate dehydrogenase flavin-adding protein (antitoxin of CptAB toxin-antitoxin module)
MFMQACSSPVQKTQDKLAAGDWTLYFSFSDSLQKVEVPIRALVDTSGQLTIVNWTERISPDTLWLTADSVHFKMPYFASWLHAKRISQDSLVGYWEDLSRENYRIDFYAKRGTRSLDEQLNSWTKTYDVSFSPNSNEDKYKAVGLFTANDNSLVGTFLTESGDYRYLEGELWSQGSEQSMCLSSFDGAHLFHFTAQMQGDSIKNGMFFSGKHWKEPWEGRKDSNVKLHDPDSLTFPLPDHKEYSFVVRNLNGDSVVFSNENLKNHVSIVQLFGSWCPNCTDESLFMKQLHKTYASQGFQVVPVAFERSDDFVRNSSQIQKQFSELQIPYPAYIGGQSSKSDASRVFNFLSKISSYPTTIVIDKKGEIRKVHTGFYGPGTGDYYKRYSQRMEMFIKELLQE